MYFTLRQLSYFRALLEHRNFGRAARACNVSQPALSVQIRALEAELGGPLVERRARDVIATPLGRMALEHANRVLAAAAALERDARDRTAGHRTLVLGLIPTLAPYLLPGVLSRLRADEMALNIRIRESHTETLLEGLNAGHLDAAVLALPAGMEGLKEVELFEDRFLLAGSRDSLRAQGQAPVLRPTDIRPEQLLLLEDGHCLTDQALEVCGMDRTGADINTGASSLPTLSRLVAEGFGLTLMPELAARAELAAAPGLCLRRFPRPEPLRRVGLVCRASTPGDGWFDALADVLRDVGQEIVTRCRNEIRPA